MKRPDQKEDQHMIEDLSGKNLFFNNIPDPDKSEESMFSSSFYLKSLSLSLGGFFEG